MKNFNSESLRRLMMLLIILIIACVHLNTIRQGHDWEEDFAQYVAHAKNLLHQRPYYETGTLENPHLAELGPKTFPPVYPALISPIYKFFGFQLVYFKIEIVLLFLLFIWAFGSMIKDQIPFQYQLLVMLSVGLSPFYITFKDQIRADLPYLFFLYLSLTYIQHVHQTGLKSWITSITKGFVAGIFIYLAYGTKGMGVLIVPSLLLTDLFISRKVKLFTMVAGVSFGALFYVQSQLFHNESSYLLLLSQYDPGVVIHNFLRYLPALSSFWASWHLVWLRFGVLVIVLVFAAIGFGSRVKQQLSVIDFFFFLHSVFILIWPIEEGLRFLLPIIPLLIFYAFVGVYKFGQDRSRKMGYVAFTLLIGSIIFSYAVKYQSIRLTPNWEGIEKIQTKELFEFVNQQTNPQDILATLQPRIMSLYTGRQATAYHYPEQQSELHDYLKSVGADYLILWTEPQRLKDGKPKDIDYLNAFIQQYGEQWPVVFKNNDFVVYKISHAKSNDDAKVTIIDSESLGRMTKGDLQVD